VLLVDRVLREQVLDAILATALKPAGGYQEHEVKSRRLHRVRRHPTRSRRSEILVRRALVLTTGARCPPGITPDCSAGFWDRTRSPRAEAIDRLTRGSTTNRRSPITPG
jgi:hypothetical protein